MNHILVIGATGNVGRQVVAQLPDTGLRVRAFARNHSPLIFHRMSKWYRATLLFQKPWRRA